MQKIQSLEHAQRILRQREVHDAQVQQLLDYLLRQQQTLKAKGEGLQSLLLASLEFTRMTMTHLEKTGHHEDADMKEAVQRVVVALQRAQAVITAKPPAEDKDDKDEKDEG